MTESAGGTPTSRPYSSTPSQLARPQPATLADILERILDKGIIIAGDIKVNLLDIELLTIKIRLLIVSVDKAKEMGIDWWRNDPMLTSSEQGLAEENRRLRERLEELEASEGKDSVDRQPRGKVEQSRAEAAEQRRAESEHDWEAGRG